MTSNQKRVMLWAIPRSLSTAMCRVMMNSGKATQILFELFGEAYYFGPDRVSSRYPDLQDDPQQSYAGVKRRLEMPYHDKELVFAKDMPYYLGEKLTAEWIPKGYTHTFITRHPRNSAASYIRVVRKQLPAWKTFDPEETGYREQVQMLRILRELGHRVVVIDADDLMDNPEAMIRAYCREVGLEFRESMINWEPLSETDFQQIFCAVWEPEWFGHVRSSSRLSRRSRQSAEMIGNDVNFDDEERYLIEKSVAKNMKYYEELHKIRLTV